MMIAGVAKRGNRVQHDIHKGKGVVVRVYDEPGKGGPVEYAEVRFDAVDGNAPYTRNHPTYILTKL